MDPLSVLRDFTIRNQLDSITQVGDHYRFGTDYTFPCSIETPYRSKQGNLYTLETLVYFIKHSYLKHHDYIKIAGSQKIPAVTLPDRKPLLDFLSGHVPSTDSIEFSIPKFDEYRPEDNTAQHHASGMDNGMGMDNDVIDNDMDSRVRDSDNPIKKLRSIETPLKDREAMLECKHRDFYSVLLTSTRRDEERQRVDSLQRKDGLVAKNRIERGYGEEQGFDNTGPKAKMLLKGSKIGEGVPIILVPSAFQTLITIYNVKEFLEDGVYISTDVKVKQMKGAKPDCVTVQKKFSRDRTVTAYEVRDKPSALKAEDWDRVVAVFVLGKEWQFKDWPFKDHVEIFNKILGFYMRFEDDSIESAKVVKQWNVKIISISKNKRHQDRAAALDVWGRLEEFMRSRSHS
ncbi:hypothetical protein LguiA_030939 [Lonicera macranthoides]